MPDRIRAGPKQGKSMFDTIASLYVEAFGLLLPAAAIGLLTLGALRAGLTQGRTAWVLGGLAALRAETQATAPASA